jgi:hypothetical protein
VTIDPTFLRVLSDNISNSRILDSYKGKGDPPEFELAYAILEISKSARNIIDNILPSLVSSKQNTHFSDEVMDFREEIRHIFYHIKDSEYLSRVIDEGS